MALSISLVILPATSQIWAAKNENLVAATALLEKGTDVNNPDEEGNIPLIEAAKKGCTEVVAFLLAKGADLDIRDRWKWTALMWASIYGHTAVVTLLIATGAKLDSQATDGETALILACEEGQELPCRACWWIAAA